MSEIPFLRVYVCHSQQGFSLWKQSLHQYEILIFEHSCCKDSVPTDEDKNETKVPNKGLKKAITATENNWSFCIHLVSCYEIFEILPMNLTLGSFSNEDGNGYENAPKEYWGLTSKNNCCALVFSILVPFFAVLFKNNVKKQILGFLENVTWASDGKLVLSLL